MAFSYARRPGARSDKKERRGGLPRLIVEVLLIAWVVRSLVFAPFSIPSGSMLPTLFIGDYVAVAKWPYGFSRFRVKGELISPHPASSKVSANFVMNVVRC